MSANTYYVMLHPTPIVDVIEVTHVKPERTLPREEWDQEWHTVYAKSPEEARLLAHKFTHKDWKSCPECHGRGAPAACEICRIRCMGG